MKLIYKLFKQNPNSHEGIVTVTSGIVIIANVIMAVLTVTVGALTGSVAIISAGINKFTDVISAVLTLAGAKLAKKRPDAEHPFGYGRAEYLAALLIAVIILITGGELLIDSIKLIFGTQELKLSYTAFAVLLITAVINYLLGIYAVKMGKKADSEALIGVGTDSRSDFFASVVILASTLIFLLTGVSVDDYAGVIVALFIIKAGYEILRDTLADILGPKGEHKLASKIFKEIESTPGIISADDMRLHNYGPESWTGSVNVEVDDSKTVGEAYEVIYELQERIVKKYNVSMVIGIYAVDNGQSKIKQLRKKIAEFVKDRKYIKNFHAAYVSENDKKIYCYFTVDFDFTDKAALEKEFSEYIAALYPKYNLELTIENEYV